MKVLDLHGCTTDEVWDKVDQFIYSSQQKGLQKVQIMTGKGTGAVKKSVLDYLKKGGYPWHYEKDKSGKPNEGLLVVIIN